MNRRLAIAMVWLAAVAGPALAVTPDQDIVVDVKKDGMAVVVNVDCQVRAPISIVWDVLTDYDNMASFISNLQYSGVQGRIDNVLEVRQTGKATRGPLSYSFDNVREVELVPYSQIRSRLIRGDLRDSAFTTRIIEADGMIHIVHSGRYTPKIWVPPLIGPALIAAETRKQYGEIRAEILRRSERRAAGLTLAH
ncbi:MAG TPA: SRPBCC family protein [Casimicrobiaceae bacterium]|nr:SRPBCC family protein [Casimicrobiaceae bacterium]